MSGKKRSTTLMISEPREASPSEEVLPSIKLVLEPPESLRPLEISNSESTPFQNEIINDSQIHIINGLPLLNFTFIRVRCLDFVNNIYSQN